MFLKYLMIAHIIGFQKSTFNNIYFCEFNLSQVGNLNSMYICILWGMFFEIYNKMKQILNCFHVAGGCFQFIRCESYMYVALDRLSVCFGWA